MQKVIQASKHGFTTLHNSHCSPPGKLEVLQLLSSGLDLGDRGEGDLLRSQAVSRLVQPATSHLAQAQAAGGTGLGLQDAQVLGLAL